jgi:hypothetical protein
MNKHILVKQMTTELKSPHPDSLWGKIFVGNCPYEEGRTCGKCNGRIDPCSEYKRMEELGYTLPEWKRGALSW